jgi:hypothetical protein
VTEQELAARLEHIERIVGEIREEVRAFRESQTEILIWRAEVEGRLRDGNRRFESMEDKMKDKLDKKLLIAYLAGAAGGAAGLIKLIGG